MARGNEPGPAQHWRSRDLGRLLAQQSRRSRRRARHGDRPERRAGGDRGRDAAGLRRAGGRGDLEAVAVRGASDPAAAHGGRFDRIRHALFRVDRTRSPRRLHRGRALRGERDRESQRADRERQTGVQWRNAHHDPRGPSRRQPRGAVAARRRRGRAAAHRECESCEPAARPRRVAVARMARALGAGRRPLAAGQGAAHRERDARAPRRRGGASHRDVGRGIAALPRAVRPPVAHQCVARLARGGIHNGRSDRDRHRVRRGTGAADGARRYRDGHARGRPGRGGFARAAPRARYARHE